LACRRFRGLAGSGRDSVRVFEWQYGYVEWRQFSDRAVLHAAFLEDPHRCLQVSPAGHRQAEVIQPAAERVNPVDGPLGVHRTQPQE
jgi:hypothetical protein